MTFFEFNGQVSILLKSEAGGSFPIHRLKKYPLNRKNINRRRDHNVLSAEKAAWMGRIFQEILHSFLRVQSWKSSFNSNNSIFDFT